MARPQKRNLDYFNHDCTQGETLYILQQKFGNDGYAIWFKLLEKLGDTEDHFLDLSKFKTKCHFSAYCMVSDEKLNEILDTLAELEAIDKKAWRRKIIWCQNFVDRHQEVYERRKGVNVPINPVNDSNNPQTKVKESKLNQINCFNSFWETYPKRNGRRQGKKKAEEQFLKLSENEIEQVLIAVKNYAQEVSMPKDAERFLSHRIWEDYLDDGEVESDEFVDFICEKWGVSDDLKKIKSQEIKEAAKKLKASSYDDIVRVKKVFAIYSIVFDNAAIPSFENFANNFTNYLVNSKTSDPDKNKEIKKIFKKEGL